MDTKLYWLKQKDGDWWGALYPQFYITGNDKEGYGLHYIRNPKVKPRTFDVDTLFKAKVLANLIIKEE